MLFDVEIEFQLMSKLVADYQCGMPANIKINTRFNGVYRLLGKFREKK